MSWLGAGVGAGIGMAIGGPIGAGIGAWIGSAIGNDKDKLVVVCPHCNKNVKIESEGQWTCPHCSNLFNYGDSKDSRQVVFFVTLFSMLGKMAKSDGVVCKEEIATVTRFMDEFKLDSEDKQAAIDIFNNAKSDNSTIYEYAQQYSEVADKEMAEIMYAALWDVAVSDGQLHTNEDSILRNIPRYLGLSESKYAEYKKTPQNASLSNIEESYNILGCTENDTDQVIKQKYRKSIMEYHPDKIQSKGLPKGFLDFSNEQVKKINQAYETIKSHRQFT